ncbi:MAG: OmpA family protein [Methylocella sp.]
MSVDFAKLKCTLAYSLLAAGLALAATGTGAAHAGEQLSVDQIIKALTPKNPSRSLTLTPADPARNAEEMQFLDSLRNRTTRSLTLDDRKKIITIVQDKPQTEIEIYFEYNLATFAPSAMSQARSLGDALSSPPLKGNTFVIEGYTDAKGGTTFNQRLSERRADAVKRFLVEQYRIPAANLRPVGYGKTRLKNENDPFGAENRRVKVVNMANNMANN